MPGLLCPGSRAVLGRSRGCLQGTTRGDRWPCKRLIATACKEGYAYTHSHMHTHLHKCIHAHLYRCTTAWTCNTHGPPYLPLSTPTLHGPHIPLPSWALLEAVCNSSPHPTPPHPTPLTVHELAPWPRCSLPAGPPRSLPGPPRCHSSAGAHPTDTEEAHGAAPGRRQGAEHTDTLHS